MDEAEIKAAVRNAIGQLIAEDIRLLELGVAERTLVASLRGYLAPHFPGWDVDAEYNRHGNGPKYLHRFRALAAAAGLSIPGRNYPYAPDIVVHHRGVDDANLLAIEIKRSSSRESRLYDHLKLQALREELGYAHTLFLELGDRASAGSIMTEEWAAL